MNKTFEEIRRDYIARYPHLASLKREGDFARAAIALAATDITTMHDLVVLARVANSPWNQVHHETDTLEDLVSWGKKGGYSDED